MITLGSINAPVLFGFHTDSEDCRFHSPLVFEAINVELPEEEELVRGKVGVGICSTSVIYVTTIGDSAKWAQMMLVPDLIGTPGTVRVEDPAEKLFTQMRVQFCEIILPNPHAGIFFRRYCFQVTNTGADGSEQGPVYGVIEIPVLRVSESPVS